MTLLALIAAIQAASTWRLKWRKASVCKIVANTATAALDPEHSSGCQTRKMTLRGCRANPVQVGVPPVRHSAPP